MNIHISTVLSSPLTLPNGQVIPNRLGKSAMSEALGTLTNNPTKELINLYRVWGEGNCGLLVTGNVMVDRNHLGEPGNIVLEDDRDLEQLKKWAAVSKAKGSKVWVQINHPGKQTPKFLTKQSVAPSAIPFKSDVKAFFGEPVALTHEQILDIIARYATAAKVAEKAGFDGAQIHGAHGYLVAQFLSPLHNQRDDEWGGSLENRMRFVCEVFKAMREATSKEFAIGIKLNSADFLRGGFTEEEAMQVAAKLVELGIDLIEVSGGTYEKPVMTGAQKASTQKREAYFLEFAEKVRGFMGDTPLMLTGGFRTNTIMAETVESGAVDLVGIARPLAIKPDFCKDILSNKEVKSGVKPLKTWMPVLKDNIGLMEIQWYTQQMKRIGQGKPVQSNSNVEVAFLKYLANDLVKGRKTNRLRA